MSELAQEKCQCGRPATVPSRWGSSRCIICHLVNRHASVPPRTAPGNIGDWEINTWMEKKLRDGFEEMLSIMRADLDTLSKKWNPPVEPSEGVQKAL